MAIGYTKPWTGGVILTSTGNQDWDHIIGGGQPLGTCLFLHQDRRARLAITLVQYWCAQALSHQQGTGCIDGRALL